MIVDSSAIVAIILKEPGYQKLYRTIREAQNVGVGAPTLVETGIVLTNRLGVNAQPYIDSFLTIADIETVSFTDQHYSVAMDAFRAYGKGRHPAKLNFGNCMTYAVAKIAGLPLIFIGDDFTKTDLILD